MQKASVVILLGALVAAQDLNSLSESCRNGLSAVQSNSAANQCTDLSGLLNIIVTPKNTSLIQPVTNWLSSFCGAPDCSSDTIASVVNGVFTACATDFQSIGVDQDIVSQALPYIQQNFGVAKEILCLADKPKDQFCATELATSLEKFIGKPLTLQTIVGSATLDLAESIPKNLTCVDCTQAILVKLKGTQLNDLVNLQEPVASQCGADFAAATALPSDILVGTGSNVPKGKNGDGSASSLAVGSLSAVAGVFLAALLA